VVKEKKKGRTWTRIVAHYAGGSITPGRSEFSEGKKFVAKVEWWPGREDVQELGAKHGLVSLLAGLAHRDHAGEL